MVHEVGLRHGWDAQHPRRGETRALWRLHASIQLLSSSSHQTKRAA